MANTPIKAKRIALGSGKLYCIKVTAEVCLKSAMDIASVLNFIKTNAIEANILGRIKGGATYNYNATTYTEKDDFSEVSKTNITDESASLSAGMVTFDLSMINQIVATAQYSSDDSGNEMVKIGGLQNDKGEKYILIFVHEDKKDGNIAVLIQGENTAAVALAFTNGAGTVTNPTFTAEPFDTSGVSTFIVTYKSLETTTTQSTASTGNT